MLTAAAGVPPQAGCLSNVFVHRHCLQYAASGCEQARLQGRPGRTTGMVRAPGELLAPPYRKGLQIPNERPRILLVVAGDHRKFGCQIFTARDNTFSSGVGAAHCCARYGVCSEWGVRKGSRFGAAMARAGRQ